VLALAEFTAFLSFLPSDHLRTLAAQTGYKEESMLELRPSCEHCQAVLPPDATDAMICSFECTFCARCVQELLHNVCPNCGGGFSPRPIRPRENRKGGNDLGTYPAGTRVVHRPVDLAQHGELVTTLGRIAPHRR